MKRFFTRLWFKYQLSRGKLVKVNDTHRGIGKTTMLIERSLKFNMPILVGNQEQIDIIKYMNPDVEVIGFAPNFTRSVVGRTFSNGVLIDESVADEMVEHLQKAYPNAIKIKGGFRNEN